MFAETTHFPSKALEWSSWKISILKNAWSMCRGVRKILVLWNTMYHFLNWRSRCLSWCISELLGLCACGWYAGEGGTQSAAWFPRRCFFSSEKHHHDLRDICGPEEIPWNLWVGMYNWRFNDSLSYIMITLIWFTQYVCIFYWLWDGDFPSHVVRFCFKFVEVTFWDALCSLLSWSLSLASMAWYTLEGYMD